MSKNMKAWCCIAPLFFISNFVSAGEVSREFVYKTLKPNNESIFEMVVNGIIEIDDGFYVPQSSPKGSAYKGSEIIAEFKRNEISATEKFKGNGVRVEAIASEIGLDIRNQGYISYTGGGGRILMSVDKHDDEIKKLSAGDKIEMICRVDSYTLNTVYMKNCFVATKEFGRRALLEVAEGVRFNTPDNKAAAFLDLTYKSNEDIFEKECKKGKKSCQKTIRSVFYDDDVSSKAENFAEKVGLAEWLASLPKLKDPQDNK